MRSSTKCALILLLLAFALVAGSAFAQQSANFALEVTCISSGVGQLSSANYGLTATVGQPAVDMVEGNSHRVWSGFLAPEDVTITYTAYDRIDELKSLPNGAAVKVSGKSATTDTSNFTGFVYIEESNRSSGIRVQYSNINGALTRGDQVTVEGIMNITAAGERVISNALITVEGGSELINPVGMTNITLGGGDYGQPTENGGGQYGPVGGVGANNVGLLVRVWGIVTPVGLDLVSINDGSGVNVTIDTSGLAEQPTGYAALTGISSLVGSAGSAERFVLAID